MWLDKLREMKDSSKLTTKEISAQSGIPEPTLEKIFAGVTKDPKLETIRQLVYCLGYTLDDLEDNPHKNTPSTTEAALGDKHISLEESTHLLAALGLNKECQQLSDDDLAFLTHIVGLLDAWFSKDQ